MEGLSARLNALLTITYRIEFFTTLYGMSGFVIWNNIGRAFHIRWFIP